MAIIDVEAPDGQFVEFEIAGDKPTAQEMRSIQNVMDNLDKYRPQEAKPEFDTKSGIKNAKLRAVLSMAENSEEEENILAKAGFAVEDYIRDDRGRLALTPSGSKKLGIESDKNIMIDEEGFSRYDLADLAGISPELTLGIAGAIFGQAAIPIPVLGAAFGATLGGATGAALEESIEGLAGVSQQTAGEIAKDIAVEGAVTGAAELVFGLPLLGIKAITKGTPGVVKEGGEQLRQAGEAREMGFSPSLGQIGASPIPSRVQRISETVIGVSNRISKNQERMGTVLGRLRSFINDNATSTNDLGQKVLSAAQAQSKQMRELERQASKEIMKSLDGVVEQTGLATTKDGLLDQKLVGAIEQSAKEFLKESRRRYTAIDDILKTSVGSENIIPTDPIKIVANGLRDKYLRPGIVGDSAVKAQIKKLVDDVDRLGDNTSFRDLYDSTRVISRIMREQPAVSSVTLTSALTDVRKAMDEALDVKNIDNLTSAQRATLGGDEGVAQLRSAAEDFIPLRQFYKSGMDDINKLEDNIGIKNIVTKIEEGQSLEAVSGMAQKLIKNNSPDAIKNLKFALGENFEPFRAQLASNFLANALQKSGIKSLDATKFRGSAFRKTIDDLGDTADELFGSDVAKVRKLAEQFDAIGNGIKINSDVIDNAIAAGLDRTGSFVGAMENAIKVGEETMVVKRAGALRNAADGKLTADEAAEVISNPNTKPEEFKVLFNALDDEGKQTVKSYYMQNILEDVGATINSQRMGELGQRILDANKGGRLEDIYGPRTSRYMLKFARTMKYLSRDSNAGDLVSQGIMANFIQKIPDILRYGVITKFLTGGTALKQVDDAWRASQGKDLQTRARIYSNAIQAALGRIPQVGAQMAQEGINEAESQAEALMESKNVDIPNISSVIPQAPSPAPGTSLSQTSPIRQQAAQDPAVAQALGIRGATAGLI